MRKISLFIFMTFVLFYSCEKVNDNKKREKVKTSISIENVNKIIDKSLMFENLLLFKSNDLLSKDVNIYANTNGLIDCRINFGKNYIITNEDTLEIDMINDFRIFSEKYDFKPKLFEQTPLNFQLYVTEELADYYEVDFGNKRKYISKMDKRFQLFSLNEFLILFPISTNLEQNPLFKSFDGNEKIELSSLENHIFKVLEIKGDFMKVETYNFCYLLESSEFEVVKGWIRFRENGRLLIKQYFSC